MDTDTIFVNDTIRPHTASVVWSYLESETIPHAPWPARSLDLNTIQHLWNTLGQRILGRYVLSGTLHELRHALLQEWALLPQAITDATCFGRCQWWKLYQKKKKKKEIVVKDRNSTREFFFDKVFPPDTKQISVDKAVVGPLIQEVLMGYNCTVFAYGQTGRGKTYTMEGERNSTTCSWEDDSGAGIIPRSLHQLFEELNKEENVEFSVRVSFLEVYNEELFDLLSSTELSRLRLFEDSNRKGSVIIQGLEEIMVNSRDEVYAILEKRTSRRQTAATMLNATSSRSHTVFSITVHIKENTIEGELLKTGKLNLVDLAGSENVGRSGAVDKRAREASNINQSLLTLGRVITALTEKQPHVPYRESKLTRLLQDSLGGHTKTSIIATISPASCNIDETISTLDYATKAKTITIKPEVNQKMTKRALIRKYTEEIERLRKDLVALRSKEGFYIDLDNHTNMINEIEVKKELIRELTEKIEELTEENTKIEELFTSTKDEPYKTCVKLDKTHKMYEKTATELSSKTDALNYTRKVLSETTLQRDENQYLIGIQKITEKKLSQQAQLLLQVEDQTTNDVSGLHAKFERKQMVEKTNEERCQDFRMMYQKQFAKLEDMVSNAEKEQIENLQSIKEDLDTAIHGFHEYQQQSVKCLTDLLDYHKINMSNLSSHMKAEAANDIQWGDCLLEKLKCKKDSNISDKHMFLYEEFPILLNQLNAKNLKTFYEHHEQLLKEFQQQTQSISTTQTNLQEEFSKKLNELQEIMSSLQTYSKCQKELNKCIFELEGTCFKIKDNIEVLKDIERPMEMLIPSSEETEKEKAILDYILGTINVKEFVTRNESIFESGQNINSSVCNLLEQNTKAEEENFTDIKTAFGNHSSFVSHNQQTAGDIFKDIETSLLNKVRNDSSLLQKRSEVLQTVTLKSTNTVNESEKAINEAAAKLKNEIFKRDLEFEKFIAEDLVKDVPTGTTPVRKTYVYSKMLVATSPHDRILQRFHTQLAADTAVAVNLPLDSSLNESEELKNTDNDVSPEVTNLNSSVSENSSCETASSVSDAKKTKSTPYITFEKKTNCLCNEENNCCEQKLQNNQA
ncbi:kinesin-like protein KIF11 [Stegodyphus dumicola]|uniref:kinesin-like protein KIF11 n=1 Tax=Stegodyphus dumicola TaxID=202533 RepID=UPI0015AA419B|nr:kinesin-like protein KIF11 [Stegodyphus dumicola]